MPERDPDRRWTDGRDGEGREQSTLDVGRGSLATAGREPRVAGSSRFADDSRESPDPGEQSRVTPDELDGQATLDGGPARRPPAWTKERNEEPSTR